MTRIELRFDSELPATHPNSKSAMRDQADLLAQRLRREPALFSALQSELCCALVSRVVEGRDLPALEQMLASLKPGEIAAQPVEDVEVEYMIPKRLEAGALPPPVAALFELPSPVEAAAALPAQK